MLALKLGLSLNKIKTLGGWQPSDETGLEAWYKYQSGITLNGSDVSAWADSSENSFNMLQATASEQPAYNSGAIEFTAADSHNLGSASDITLSGAFTIGIRLNPDAINIIVIGDNTTGENEFIKLSNSSSLRMKIDGSAADITVNDGDLLADNYLVLTRNSSDLISLYVNGTLQTDTETLAGTANMDTIGVRAVDLNPYDGTISEIQIYDTESAALTANVNTYLSKL